MMILRTVIVFLIASISTSLTAFAQNPGMIVVLGETPETAVFRVPENSPYKFQYDPARITLWDSLDRQNAISSGAVFQAGVATPGCEVGLAGYAAFQTCFSGDGGGVAPGCAGFDADVDDDIGLDDYGAFHGTFIGPVCNVVFVPVFAEGLTTSTALGDAVITLLTDPDGDDKFAVEATQPVTVVSIDIAPTSGPVGTEIVVTLQPAVGSLAFDPLTTAEWSGVFQPIVGSPSDLFTITYSASRFRESTPSVATVIVGEGSGLPPPPSQGVPPGTLVGTLSITLSDHTLRHSLDFQIAGSLVDWFRIHYPADEFGYLDEPPALSATALDRIPLYEVPSVGAVPEFLSVAFYYHTACVLLLDENSITATEAPASFTVDLISFDSSGVEVDRVLGVVLALDTADGDPNHLTYHSDLGTPIMHIEGTIDKQQFPDQIILLATDGGTVTAMEASP